MSLSVHWTLLLLAAPLPGHFVAANPGPGPSTAGPNHPAAAVQDQEGRAEKKRGARAQSPGGQGADVDALAVYARFRELAADALWPGFAPLEIPVAIYDGKRTVLFGHPEPPAAFVAVDAFPGVHWMNGAHESVRANTSIDLGGARTATLLLDPQSESTHEPAAVLVHEAFHVFQETAHPRWRADESALFDYPIEASEVLVLRRLEVESLRRALASLSPSDMRGWARLALEYRSERQNDLASSSREYERAIERYEGLADYIQARCLDSAPAPLPEAGYAPEDIRLRCYGTGAALARVLDRLGAEWRRSFQAESEPHLDEFLRTRLGAAEPGAERATFTDEELNQIADLAVLDAARLRIRLQDERREFSDREGWSIEVQAPDAAPLFPQGFDPLNVRRFGPLEILHTRWVKLGNLGGSLEVQDIEALTYGAGAHALFQGVARALLTGFSDEPAIDVSDGGVVTIDAPGVHGSFAGAGVRREGTRWIVELGS